MVLRKQTALQTLCSLLRSSKDQMINETCRKDVTQLKKKFHRRNIRKVTKTISKNVSCPLTLEVKSENEVEHPIHKKHVLDNEEIETVPNTKMNAAETSPEIKTENVSGEYVPNDQNNISTDAVETSPEIKTENVSGEYVPNDQNNIGTDSAETSPEIKTEHICDEYVPNDPNNIGCDAAEIAFSKSHCILKPEKDFLASCEKIPLHTKTVFPIFSVDTAIPDVTVKIEKENYLESNTHSISNVNKEMDDNCEIGISSKESLVENVQSNAGVRKRRRARKKNWKTTKTKKSTSGGKVSAQLSSDKNLEKFVGEVERGGKIDSKKRQTTRKKINNLKKRQTKSSSGRDKISSQNVSKKKAACSSSAPSIVSDKDTRELENDLEVSHPQNVKDRWKPKQFVCDLCNCAFDHKYDRLKHELIHSEEKQYRCEMCEFSTYRSSYLQNHMDNAH